ncbi:MAG: ATP-binding cassette domain-containing protein [Alphaproteobacteria bacterium]|nr:ATP-binding cassette domain-containing protein [Alphaproteobacteria bacterium]
MTDSKSGQSDVKSLQGEFESAYVAGPGAPDDVTPVDDPHQMEAGETLPQEFDSEDALDEPNGPDHSDIIDPPTVSLSVIVGSVLINLLALATPLVILQVYDRIIPNQALHTFTLLIFGLLGALILESIMRTARSWLTGWSAAKYEVKAAESHMRKILDSPSSIVQSERSSIHVHRLNAIDTLRQFYGGQSRLLLIDLPFVLLFVGLIAIIAGPLLFIPVFLIGAFGALTVRHGAMLRDLLVKRNDHDIERHGFVLDALSSMSGVKSNVSEGLFQRTHDKFCKRGSDLNYNTVVLSAEAHSLSSVFSNAAIVVMVSFGAFHVLNGQLSIGALAAVTLLTGRSMQPLVRALGLWSQIQNLQIARTQLAELMEMNEEEADPESGVAAPLRGEVVVRGVSHRPEHGFGQHLDLINLTARANKLTVIRPMDGGGVRELCDLICGDVKPIEGQVEFDGGLASELGVTAIRKQVACVSEQSVLFDGTLLQNITMFRRGKALDDALEVAQLIGLEDQVNLMPEGYGTRMIKGSSTFLPSGLLQQLMLARALARKPKVLILINPLQRLDRVTEQAVLEALRGELSNMTIIAFTHHPGLVQMADHVYELTGGKLRAGREKPVRSSAPRIKLGAMKKVAND